MRPRTESRVSHATPQDHVFETRASRSSADACHLRLPGTDRCCGFYCIGNVNIDGPRYTSGGSDSVHKCGMEKAEAM